MNDLERTFQRLLAFEDMLFGQGVSEAAVREAESALMITIFGEYRAFLRRFGWMRHVREEIFGLGPDVPAHLDLIAVTQRERNKSQPRMRQEFLPFHHDGWGNFHCLVQGKADEPRVVLWEHEEGPQQIPEVVAPSFSTWLDGRLDALEEERSG